MRNYFVLLVAGFFCAASARAQSVHEAFFAHTLFQEKTAYHILSEQLSVKLSSINTQLGMIYGLSEDLGIRFEYGFAQSDYALTDMWKERRFVWKNDKLDVNLHSIMVGAQHKLSPSLIAWSGLTLAAWHGTLAVRDFNEANADFDFEGLYIYNQVGIGNRWMINDRYAIGIDWLVISIYLSRHASVHNLDEMDRIKGLIHDTKTEVKNVVDDITSLRLLSLRVSLFL